MITYLARAVTRVVALIVLPILALAALAFVVAAIVGQHTAASIARSTRLTHAWRAIGTFLAHVAPAGHAVVVLAAVAAVLLGVVILLGGLTPTRERELHMADGDETLGIRRRALQNALQTVPAQVGGTTAVKARLRARRRKLGGIVRVSTTRSPRANQDEIDASVIGLLEPLTTAFALRARVRGSVGRGRAARTE